MWFGIGKIKMRFCDIPKFTSVGSYQINVSWDYLEHSLKHWNDNKIPGSGVELCPDFQRGHVWDEDKQIRYVEYILRGGRSGREIYWNCSSWMREFNTPIQLVDGLQRVTAVRKFMNNEIKAFGIYCNEFEDKLGFDYDFIFNVNNLKTRAEVLQWYIELNEGGVVHTKEEIARVKALLKEEQMKRAGA